MFSRSSKPAGGASAFYSASLLRPIWRWVALDCSASPTFTTGRTCAMPNLRISRPYALQHRDRRRAHNNGYAKRSTWAPSSRLTVHYHYVPYRREARRTDQNWKLSCLGPASLVPVVGSSQDWSTCTGVQEDLTSESLGLDSPSYEKGTHPCLRVVVEKLSGNVMSTDLNKSGEAGGCGHFFGAVSRSDLAANRGTQHWV